MKNKLTMLAVLLGAAGLAAPTLAQDKVKIGFITDMSSLYADVEGKNGALAIQMAIDDFGGKVLGMPIELISADHQNKADIAASKAREWIDTEGLTMLFGGTNSGTALASAKVAAEKKRVYINNGAASSALTNEQCTPYTVHYAYDTVALAKGTGTAIVETGGKSWYFLTADYAFGHALEADTSSVVKAKGGTVVGAVRHPLNASDFSSFLLQAQNSKAQVLG
ncbi:MAG: ABC transporter substrate-binding protein, partial [Burkholderiaceae bacterium]|nr:ABC transporter substrate-binding protein [Burkholderiaceae bacterium]